MQRSSSNPFGTPDDYEGSQLPSNDADPLPTSLGAQDGPHNSPEPPPRPAHISPQDDYIMGATPLKPPGVSRRAWDILRDQIMTIFEKDAMIVPVWIYFESTFYPFTAGLDEDATSLRQDVRDMLCISGFGRTQRIPGAPLPKLNVSFYGMPPTFTVDNTNIATMLRMLQAWHRDEVIHVEVGSQFD